MIFTFLNSELNIARKVLFEYLSVCGNYYWTWMIFITWQERDIGRLKVNVIVHKVITLLNRNHAYRKWCQRWDLTDTRSAKYSTRFCVKINIVQSCCFVRYLSIWFPIIHFLHYFCQGKVYEDNMNISNIAWFNNAL